MKLIAQWGRTLAVLALAAVIAAGCGSSQSNEENGATQEAATASPQPTATADAAEPSEDADDTPATRTVTTLAGEVDIPTAPERIVLTYDDDVDHFMALGLKPASVPTYNRTDNVDGYLPYLADQLQGVSTYELVAGLEPILAAEPDLIVAGYFHQDYFEELQKIAPTVYFEWQVDWRDTHLEMGRILGFEDKAKANVDAFHAELERTKAYLAEVIGDEPVAFIRVRQNQLELYGGAGTGSSASFILYDLLELTPVEEAPTDNWGGPFSLEYFTNIKAEHIFLNVQENDENTQLVEELLTSALYKNVPAIQKDQVYKVSTYPWERGGPIAFTEGMKQIRELVKRP